MSVLHRSPRSAFLLALAATFVATSTAVMVAPPPAAARQSTKKPPQQRPSPSLSVDVPAPAPARYFTINQVLAKRDSARTSGAGPQYASTSATMTDAPPAGGQLLPSSEPFGLSTFRAPEGLLWVKWRDIEQHLQAEAKDIARCKADRNNCSPPARQFLALVEDAQARTGRARIEAVNRAVNAALRYISDLAQHGVADRWTAPLVTLAAGRGDCEDYAIAKYAILRAAGVPSDDLRLLLVHDRAVRQDHAVLAVRDNGRWLVLDNRHLMLGETETLWHFTPLFALDHAGVSLFAAPYAGRRLGETGPASKGTAGTRDKAPIKPPSNQRSSQAAPSASPNAYLL
jgi:predicted transglutaminase-like cysteine proteinase